MTVLVAAIFFGVIPTYGVLPNAMISITASTHSLLQIATKSLSYREGEGPLTQEVCHWIASTSEIPSLVPRLSPP